MVEAVELGSSKRSACTEFPGDFVMLLIALTHAAIPPMVCFPEERKVGSMVSWLCAAHRHMDFAAPATGIDKPLPPIWNG